MSAGDGRSEVDEAARLKVLLGLLADADCRRRGLVCSPDDARATLRWYRARFGLLQRGELIRSLAAVGLTETELDVQVRTLTHVTTAMRVHAEELQRRLPRYRAIFSVREWLLLRESQEVR
ncbi:MAG TPA: hypothetical protein VFG69_06010 [Nannocystaceae bacterium]|nr:hypothetical protein [Nannocystaceae bacterium]